MQFVRSLPLPLPLLLPLPLPLPPPLPLPLPPPLPLYALGPRPCKIKRHKSPAHAWECGGATAVRRRCRCCRNL